MKNSRLFASEGDDVVRHTLFLAVRTLSLVILCWLVVFKTGCDTSPVSACGKETPTPYVFSTSAASAVLPTTGTAAGPDLSALDATTQLDWFCLQQVYPQLRRLAMDADGLWLMLDDGQRVLYAAAPQAPPPASPWVTDVRTAMADPYPLEPERPDTPLGVSPGRRRSYALLEALYGDTPAAVRAHLQRTTLLGQPVWLVPAAAQALARASAILASRVAATPELRPWLRSAGGFVWRRIAGETRLSPHAFGIAFDISPDKAAYWRWSRVQPHPMQRTYPAVIVEALENEGFIWGGKWHEYDLMHFEYRPEILCKAREQRAQRQRVLLPATPPSPYPARAR